MTQTLDEISIILIYSAMAVYALAFIAFTLDLARRSSTVKKAVAAVPAQTASEEAPLAEVAAVGAAASGGAPRKGRAAAGAAGDGSAEGSLVSLDGIDAAGRRSLALRLGVAFTVLGFVIQLAGVVLRGIAASRVPWANMYEFSITGTLLIVAVFLVVLVREDLRFLGAFVTGLVLVLLGVSTVNYYVSVVPLPPALQSAWLVIHVLVAILGTAFFALGGALSVIQLLQTRGDGLGRLATKLKLRFLRTLPDAETLERLAYRVNIVGFVFWTFTLIAGAIWAERAWGRYWGWDTKEVWTFIIWVIYAGYIHARATRGWRGSRSAWLAIIGFAAVLFNFGVVNVFFKGLHAYSGL
ncbi:c-type cytochrome biogenesis protein CcsB [Herbiconiux moechotypicola]|uniref:C-type cytochrome biogenesis protein CcsB n=1 Tax=Herbiconiux moechotypicola TaxID=637393 RepID=A0ABN3E0P8_9MICO|nr:c-type cytochrome biogenesis protein CcsB [Herbiconiux moechotypicola]MCS5731135.1 c-type cytochrome biogenesis protein CcsB [Herbiconiux moechotypicola]